MLEPNQEIPENPVDHRLEGLERLQGHQTHPILEPIPILYPTDQDLEELKRRIILERKAHPMRMVILPRDHQMTMTEMPPITDQEHLVDLIRRMRHQPTRPNQLVAAGWVVKMTMPDRKGEMTNRIQEDLHLEGVVSPKSRRDHRCPKATSQLHQVQLRQTRDIMTVYPNPEPTTLTSLEMASSPLPNKVATDRMAQRMAMQMERSSQDLTMIVLTPGQ
jgi:hypothetical protein